MILDDETRTVLANVGWADRGSIWKFDLRSRTHTQIPVEGADYLTLKPGNGDLFRVTHHRSEGIAASIRRNGEPATVLSTLVIEGDRARLEGDVALWTEVDASLLIQSMTGPKLFWIDTETTTAKALDLSWYNENAYDLGYQGLTDSLSLPDGSRVIVSVQRSSELVIIDVTANRKTGSITLADRGGNPGLTLVSRSTFLASDYDTLCLVKPDALLRKVVRKRQLQEATSTGMRQFIGDYFVNGSRCAVARPFSNDVVVIDLRNFRVLARVPVECQPIDVCLVSASEFVVRDWQSGRVEIGRLA